MNSRKTHRTAVDAEAVQKTSAEAPPVCKMKHQT